MPNSPRSGGRPPGAFSALWETTEGGGRAVLRFESLDGKIGTLTYDSPVYSFVLVLLVEAEGVRELRLTPRSGLLARRDIRPLPLPMADELVKLATDVMAAVRDAVEVGLDPDVPSWVAGPDAEAINGLGRMLAALRKRQDKRSLGRHGREQLRARVVQEYRLAVQNGDRAPRRVVSERVGYSVQYVAQLLAEARRAGELGATVPGRKGWIEEGEG